MTIQEAIKAVVAGDNLTVEQSTEVFTEIMSGASSDAQIAALIVALRMKGESVEEITGAASVMREKATKVLPETGRFVVDTCGTGGDGANTFNISTAAAFVCAGAGAQVAKHGNRSVSSKCGSADVLEALGVSMGIAPAALKECLDKIGIVFLFAPALHSAMKYAIGPRREIGIRTIFNILGPLTNPSLAPHQLMGVFSAGLTEVMAAVLGNMGIRHAYVVHGLDGLDEISLSAATKVSEVRQGTVKTYTIQPEDFGLGRVPRESLAGGTPAHNAQIIREILDNVAGPPKDIVLINAAFGLAAAGIAKDPLEGMKKAAESIDSGAAREKLDELIKFTNNH